MKQIFLFTAFVLLLTFYSCRDKTEVKSLNLKGNKALKPSCNWIYKNKQIAYFDSVYCKTFGPDTAAARFTLFLMDATTLCNLIKIYPDSKDSLVLITITEFANDNGKLKVEAFNRIQQPYTIKLEKQINYLVKQIDSLSILSNYSLNGHDETYLYYNVYKDSLTLEASLGYEIYSVKNQFYFRNVLTGIWLLTSSTLYRNIFDWYPYSEEQGELLNN